MFIPLHDANSLKYIKLQYVTLALIAANVVVYLMTSLGSAQFSEAAVIGFSYIPSVAFDIAQLPPQYEFVPESLTYVTYTFLHGDIFHLGGNMLFLWVFGDNVEDALGHVRYFFFYFICGAVGAFLHGIVAMESQMPLIGASGAIAGIVTAYLVLHPRVKIWVLAFGRIPLRIPAYAVLALWILFQISMFALGGDDQISWACHVGGILAGGVLVFLLRRSDVPLLDKAIVTPDAVVVEDNSAVAPGRAGPVPRWGRQ
ncbi:rhomboid family intramembrane serine protease [Mesorhizobium sp. NBSH29]|uniref:rhomboid family intramembrane serine protease n=1 Tax=Mesorhizobium sp. NBSH29 TaxID=2654249 RepID=UPI00189642C2|nr:rhomboid family intramembrane serine protease [Mesorhizobium sp. NBSH29]QPC85654.1 rhomboid family intramembrane serine protease [Mesorhizobium sp. NBSH29]